MKHKREQGWGPAWGRSGRRGKLLNLSVMSPEDKTEDQFQHWRPARLQAGSSPGPRTPEAAVAQRVGHTRVWFKGQTRRQPPSAGSRIHHSRAHQG